MRILFFEKPTFIEFNKYRLLHSEDFIEKTLLERQEYLKSKNKILDEKKLIHEYLVEKNEIIYTWRCVFYILQYIITTIGIVNFIIFTSNDYSFCDIITFVSLLGGFLLYHLVNKRYETLVMNNMAIDLSDRFYDDKMKKSIN